MNILITGATGYIGRNLINHLLKKMPNSDIVALVRGGKKNPWDDNQVQLIQGDLTSLSQDAFHGRHYDVVIHLAALMSNYDYLPASEFQEVNVEGSRKLINALRECRVGQFIHISTVGVYGPTGLTPVCEAGASGENLSVYESSKLESEAISTKSCQKQGIPLTILRLGLMYGEGMNYGWPSVVESIKKGKMRIIGNGQSLIQLSYIQDVVEGVTLAVGNNNSYGLTFNLCGDDVCSISDVFDLIAKLLEVPLPKRVPYIPFYLLSHVLTQIPNYLKPNKLKLITPHRIRFFRENHVYSTDRAKKILEFSARYDTRAGMLNLIRAYEKSSEGQR